MASVAKMIRNFYRDSVALMQLSSQLGKLPGVRQASAVMASEANLACCARRGCSRATLRPVRTTC